MMSVVFLIVNLGGLPYLGVDDEVPLSTDNKQLRLLGQINFADLPMNSYQLEAGLLQFWAMDNDLYGLDFENMISQAEVGLFIIQVLIKLYLKVRYLINIILKVRVIFQ